MDRLKLSKEFLSSSASEFQSLFIRAMGCRYLGHSCVCYSCRLRGPKFVHSGNGQPLLALRHLVSLPVSTPLRSNCKPLLVRVSL